MIRNILLISLVAIFSFASTNGQSGKSNSDLEKFQTISTKNASEIVVTGAEKDYYNFGDNRINETSIIVKIKVSSETFPNRILRAMIEQGDFNVRYKVTGGQLVISQLKKNQEIRFDGQTHKINFSYDILVPNSVAYQE